MSDYDALIAAIEEARRIISLYDSGGPRPNQDELLTMLQFILCAPSVAIAMNRLKSIGRSGIIAGNDNIESTTEPGACVRSRRTPA